MSEALLDRRGDSLWLIVVHSLHKVHLTTSPMDSLGRMISVLHSEK